MQIYESKMPISKLGLIFFIKVLVSVGMIAMLFYRWADFIVIAEGIKYVFKEHSVIILFIISLIFLNWSAEALKWTLLLKNISKTSFVKALNYVLTGVTVGFITPGRSGEFAGRMILMPNDIRLKSLPLSFLGGIAQVIPLVLIALILSITQHFNPLGRFLDVTILSISIVLFLIAFFEIEFFIRLPIAKSVFKKLNIESADLPNFRSKILILIVSFVRYLIFSLQYVLLLSLLGGSVSDFIAPVSWMLLLQSLSPAVALLDFGVRGSIAFWVFSAYNLFQPSILSAVFLIWFFNLCIPAIMGYFLILNWNEKK